MKKFSFGFISVVWAIALALILSDGAHAQSTRVFVDSFTANPTTGVSLSLNNSTPTGTLTSALGTYSAFTNNSSATATTAALNGTGASPNNVLRISGATGLNGTQTIVTSPFSPYSSTFNGVMKSNGIVSWVFTMRTNSSGMAQTVARGLTNSTTGTSPGNASFATVIAASSSSLLSATTSGWAVIYTQPDSTSGTGNYKLDFGHFTTGLGSGTNNFTTLITTGASAASTLSKYLQIKIVYNSLTNAWSMFTREDGTNIDPLSGASLTQVGSTVISSVNTTTTMTHYGFYSNHKATTNAFFDNFNVFTSPVLANPSSATFSGFTYAQGVGPSTAQTVSDSALGLSQNLTVTPSTNYEVSVPALSIAFTNSPFNITPAQAFANIPLSFSIRLKAGLAQGSYNGETVTLSTKDSSAATISKTITCNGTVSAAAVTPTITYSTASFNSAFANTAAGSNSSSSSFTVNGSNLGSNPIVITAPTNFAVSTDNSSFSTSASLSPTSGTVSTTTIYVRYSPSGTGAYSGNLTLSNAASSVEINSVVTSSATVAAVSGYVSPFYYKGSGSLATLANWSAKSDGTGSAPSDFATAGVSYLILNNATTDAAWTVSGTGSKIILGSASNSAVTLTVASGFAITGTVDIAAASSGSNKLVVAATSLPTFGTLNAASTVEIQSTLTFNGSGTSFGLLNFTSGTQTVTSSVTAATVTVAGATVNVTPASSTAIIITGNLAVSSGSFTLSNTNISSFQLTGNLTQTGGTITLGSGATVSFTTSSIGGSLNISGGTLNNASVLTIGSDFIISGTGFYRIDNNASGRNVTVSGHVSFTGTGGLNKLTSGSTFTLNLAGVSKNLTMTATNNDFTKCSFSINSGASYTLLADVAFGNAPGRTVTIAGTLNTSGFTFDLGQCALAATGTINNATGTIRTSYSRTIANTSAVNAIQPNFTWGGTVVFALTTGAQLVPAGTYNNLTILNTSGTDTLGGSIVVNGALTTTSGGTFDLSSNNTTPTFTLTGTLASISNNGIIKTSVPTSTSATPLAAGKTWGGTGTVQYYATNAAQTIVGGTYNSLTLFNTSGTTATAGGDITVNGTFANASGTFDLSTFRLIEGTSYSTVLNSTATIGTSSTNSLPLPSGKTWAGTIQYAAATGGQTVATGTYNNLTLSNTSGSNTVSGAITVNGNWSNSGTFDPSTGTVTFGGSSASTITNSSGTENFYNLIVNDASGLALSSPVNVANVLTLTNGVLTTTGTNLLTITNTSTNAISGGGLASYINGPAKLTLPSNTSGSATFVFPLGKEVNATPTFLPFALVDPVTGSGSVTVTAEAFGSGSSGSVDNTLNAIAPGYWSVSTAGNFTSSNVSLTSTVDVSSSSVVAKSTGGAYTTLSGTVSGNTVTSVSTITGGAQTLAVGLEGLGISSVVPTNLGIAQTNYTGYFGQTITVNGSGFSAFTTLKINGTSVAIASQTASALTFVVPANATTGTLTLLENGITATGNTFTVIGSISAQAGDWSSGSTWLGGNVPVNGLSATVVHNVNVTTTVPNTVSTLTIASGASLVFGSAGVLTTTVAVANAGTLNMSSGGTLNVGGTFTNTNLFTAGTGTVVFNGNSVQAIPASTFNNLSVTNTGGTTSSSAITVNGTLNIVSGATLSLGTNVLSGSMTSATGTGTLLTNALSATPVPSGATWAGTVNFGAAGVQTVVAGTYNNLTISNARGGATVSLAANGTIAVAGTLSVTATGAVYANSGSTVSFTGASNQSVPNAFAYNNLTIANSAIATAAGATTVSGNLTLTSGTFNDGGNTITLSGSIAGGTGTHTTTGSGKIRMTTNTKTIAANVTLGTLELAISSGNIQAPTDSMVSGIVQGPFIDSLVINGGSYYGNGRISRALNLNGGTYNVGSGGSTPNARLTLYNNSTVYRNSTSGSVSGSGQVRWGQNAGELVNITINQNGSNGAEINGSEFPGNIGTLTIASGAVYSWSSSRNVTNLVNNGVLAISSSANVIKGTISGNGKIASYSGTGGAVGTSSASLTLSNTGTGSAGTLTLTDTSRLNNLTLNCTGTNGGITLGNSFTLAGSLTLSAGTLNDGGKTLTVGAAINGSGTHTGTGKILMTSVANNISAVTLGNLEIQSTGTIGCASSPTITGNLIITSGTFFDNGKNVFLAGNLTGAGAHTGTGKISMTGISKTVSLPSVANLEINSAGTVTVGANIAVSGDLTLTAGTFNDGGKTITLAGNLSATSGTLSCSGALVMTATNAAVNIAGQTFNKLFLNGANGFSMNGTGTVNDTLQLTSGVLTVGSNNPIVMANNSTIVRAAGSFSGTPIYGSASTDVVNVSITGSCTNGNELPSSPTNGKAGKLTVASGASYTLTGGRTVTSLENNGTLVFTPATTFTFTVNGGSLTGTGTITGHTNASINYAGNADANLNFTNGSAFANNLTINAAGKTLTLADAVSISGSLNLTAGTLDNATNNITFASNKAVITRTAGALTAAPVFSSKVNVSYNGTSSTTTGFEIPAVGSVLDTFTVSNSAGVVLASDVTVNGRYAFSSGKVTLGNFNLTFGSDVTTTGTPSSSKYVVVNGTGTFTRKSVGNTATQFPIGTATSFAPITVTNTSGTSDITAFIGTAFTSAPIDATKMVNLQWSLTTSAATTATLAFQFNSGDKAASYSVGTNDLGLFTTNTYYATSSITTSGTSTITGTKTAVSLVAGTNLLVIGNTGAVESTNTTWTGTQGTDWNTNGNWTNGAPGSGQDAFIAATNNKPIVTGTQSVNKLIVNSGALLTNNGTLNIGSSFTHNGTIAGSGTTALNGSSLSQTITGTGTVASLTINNPLGASVSSGSNELYVTGVLTLRNGTFTTNGNLTLKSNSIASSGTVASIGTGGNTGTLSGTVTVERYIPTGYRAYRDLAVGVKNAGSIFNNWQEGGSATSGYGVFITGTTSDSTTDGVDATGIDKSMNGVKSAYKYGNGAWSNISNTKNETLNPYRGYRLLVRGDRSFSLFTTPVNMPYAGVYLMMNATRLRASGSLVTGNVAYSTTGVDNGGTTDATFNLNAEPNGYSAVGNPYMAPIDWTNISNNGRAVNLTNTYYFLDPTIGISGAYVSYNASSGASNGNDALRYIQPGQGFYVENSGSNAPTLTITEADKATSATKTSVFGKSVQANRIAVALKKNLDGADRLMDMASLVFDAKFNTAVGTEDARKLTNPNDNLSIVNGKQLLSVDGRKTPVDGERIALNLGQLTTGEYALSFDASRFVAEGLEVYLEDAATNERKQIVGQTAVPISVKAPATLENRFALVFKAANKAATVALESNSLGQSAIFPNPSNAAALKLKLSGLEAGKYQVVFTNVLGQVVNRQVVNHIGQVSTLSIAPSNKLATGKYVVSVYGTEGNVKVLTTALEVTE